MHAQNIKTNQTNKHNNNNFKNTNGKENKCS